QDFRKRLTDRAEIIQRRLEEDPEQDQLRKRRAQMQRRGDNVEKDDREFDNYRSLERCSARRSSSSAWPGMRCRPSRSSRSWRGCCRTTTPAWPRCGRRIRHRRSPPLPRSEAELRDCSRWPAPRWAAFSLALAAPFADYASCVPDNTLRLPKFTTHCATFSLPFSSAVARKGGPLELRVAASLFASRRALFPTGRLLPF
ncbi:unnamed protein product, partial [Prorocentrum cordatum]